MAQRRMFSKTITNSDKFIELSISAQVLYFHLSMEADDDGFVNSPKKIQRILGTDSKDLELLEKEGFIFCFDSGVVVISHWRMNNSIQNDRYKPTVFKDEMKQLMVKDGVYTRCIQDVSGMETQNSIVKDSIVKNSIEEDSKVEVRIDEDRVKGEGEGKHEVDVFSVLRGKTQEEQIAYIRGL